MKLYYAKGACSLSVRILINELNLPSEFESVEIHGVKKTQSGQDFLTINPKGCVPVLELDDKSVLTEAGVILQYLADNHGGSSVLPSKGIDRYRVLEWVNFLCSDIHKGFGPLFNPGIPPEIKEKAIIPLLRTRFDVIEAHLKTHKMLFKEQFTIADCYAFVLISWFPHFKFSLSDWPAIERYFKELRQRPSIVKSLAQEQEQQKAP